MSLADRFKDWLQQRVLEEMPEAERARYNRVKEHLRGPLSPEVRVECIAEIRSLEQRYGLPRSNLHAD